jgi:hypothetical protein
MDAKQSNGEWTRTEFNREWTRIDANKIRFRTKHLGLCFPFSSVTTGESASGSAVAPFEPLEPVNRTCPLKSYPKSQVHELRIIANSLFYSRPFAVGLSSRPFAVAKNAEPENFDYG